MTTTNPPPAFQPLPARLAGLPVDETRYEDVPHHLEQPLRDWVHDLLRGDEPPGLCRRVMLRLRWERKTGHTYFSALVGCGRGDLLTVVDAALQLHPGWDWPCDERGREGPGDWFADRVMELDGILVDGGSGYRVEGKERRLGVRHDETVRAAADQAVTTAPPTAGMHLRVAWMAAYSLSPDPDKAFNEAVRAVETVACPLVEPKRAQQGTSTLGTVIRELTTNDKWTLVLPDQTGQPRDGTAAATMMQVLWQAQVSRHGGAPKSRRQDQAEAEAAVHLAALLVQWLSAGWLTRRP